MQLCWRLIEEADDAGEDRSCAMASRMHSSVLTRHFRASSGARVRAASRAPFGVVEFARDGQTVSGRGNYLGARRCKGEEVQVWVRDEILGGVRGCCLHV